MALDFFAVFDLDEYQDIQDTFSKSLGVRSITVLPSGKPITQPSNYFSECAESLENSRKINDNCIRCNAELGTLNTSGPIIKQCPIYNGIWHAEVSIVVNGVHIANWCIRQIKNKELNAKCLLLSDDEIKVNTGDNSNELDESPYMSNEAFVQAANILYLFVNQLADKAHKNLLYKHQLEEIERTNELLTKSERRYRLLFEKSNDAIFVVKLPEGQYIDANDAAVKLTGRTREEINKLKTSDLSPRNASKRLQQFVSGEYSNVYERVEYIQPDGTIRLVNLSVLSIDKHSIFGIAQDITEQVKASEALKHSNDLMQYIIEHNLSAIAIHDKDLRYIYVSEKYLEYYNLKGQQLIGKYHYDVFPEIPQKWREAHQLALNGIVTRAEEDSYERADGSIEWGRWECRPWYDQNNEIGGIIINTELITQRMNLEISLRESEEKYKYMFYNNPQPNGIYDIETLKFLEVNDAAVILYGYSREEFLEMTIKDFIPKEDIVKLMDELGKAIPKYNKSGPWRHIKKNGEIIYVEASSHLIEYHDKQARHLLINDITDKVRTEEKIRAAQKKAEENDRLKSAFLANMSHEIRTPLNSILGFAELINDPHFGDKEKNGFVETMKLNGERLLSLIGDILDLSKIEAGQIQLERQLFSVNELLSSIQVSQTLLANKRGLELVLNSAFLEDEIKIFSDKNRVVQVFYILLNNAIKFTDKGYIEFGISSIDDFLQFYVKDTGPGISKDYHDYIFERFLQIDHGINRKFEGSGLGLTIAKNLVELLGGSIWLESSVDKGSTFYFTLPKE